MQNNLRWLVTVYIWLQQDRNHKLLPPDSGLVLCIIARMMSDKAKEMDPTGAVFVMVCTSCDLQLDSCSLSQELCS